MLRTRPLRILLGIGFMLLMVGCVPVSDGSTSEACGLSRPTLTPPALPVQNTATVEAAVKFIIDKPPVDETGGVEGLAFSPDGKFMALAGIPGVIYIWDVESHKTFSTLIGERSMVTGVIFSPN